MPAPLRFSANLGFLWSDLPLPDAIRAAAKAGFDAVECHWPYDTPVAELRTALQDTGLRMLCLNTSPGNRERGEFGLAALPGRVGEARAAIDRAVDYAGAIDAPMVHVMAGRAEGPAARSVFEDNLRYACTRAAPYGIRILIEPLNGDDVPGYLLNRTADAAAFIDRLELPALSMICDCYHMARMGEDVAHGLATHLPQIGHVQIAGVPDRGPPDRGVLDYVAIFRQLQTLGYEGYVGAEYRPVGRTEDSLAWLGKIR